MEQTENRTPNNVGAKPQNFNEELSAMKEEMRGERETRSQLQAELVFKHLVSKINDLSSKLFEIKCAKTPINSIRLYASEVIVAACRDDLTVPSYSERSKSQQTAYLFVGTHWVKTEHQAIIDFTREACEKMGLYKVDEESSHANNFIVEQILFKLSKARPASHNAGEVLLNLQNGTLHISADGTATLQEHRREDFFTYVLPYGYDPNAGCQLWEKFLNEMLPEPDKQRVLAEFIAYCFCKTIKAEKMLVLYGTGANGKSVVMDVVSQLFGTENVSNVDLSDLSRNDEKRAQIENKLINISTENDRELKTGKLKQIISNEPVDARTLYVGTHTMYNYSRLMASFNQLPPAEQTHGYFRRFQILEFTKTIQEGQMDLNLAKKLCTELPGILNWVIKAMKGFVERGDFSESQSCREALIKYRERSNSVALFVNETCTKCDTPTKGIELFKAYLSYCSFDRVTACGKQNFYERLEALGYKKISKANCPHFHLKPNDESAD